MQLFLAAESTGGLAALGLNWTGLVFQLINFGILYFVLSKYAFPGIVRLLENRRRAIEEGLEQAAEARRAKESADVERKQILESARTEASTVIEAARTEARKDAERIMSEAQASADAKVATAEQRIAQQAREARTELMAELGGIVATTTATVTRDEITPKADAAVIKKALQGVTK